MAYSCVQICTSTSHIEKKITTAWNI
ncbi:hypothetical protein P5673_007907 [Acropora cervicornis]|uniref:Uncharacterized protein n=1 Tax=Acropora cervicornis TaxID=6130 RepID=A0AAD9QV94_ACRCE|nr:hypothetical protein P5673_007907 [Acropora cervicornis]